MRGWGGRGPWNWNQEEMGWIWSMWKTEKEKPKDQILKAFSILIHVQSPRDTPYWNPCCQLFYHHTLILCLYVVLHYFSTNIKATVFQKQKTCFIFKYCCLVFYKTKICFRIWNTFNLHLNNFYMSEFYF